ncbi:MAG TPA: cisplatin damage response ATP-dependent DNA ligase [Alphaproteobacteria bacterium]|nr:cisplatin damage response ATP-dependent DNA ligase [Alphaproteobacteria bacterium]
MRRFAELLEGLVFQPARNGKLRLIETYFRETPDPDRGYGLAALTNSLAFTQAKPALIRGLVEARVDPVLFGWSWDFVGDLAETAALIWPERASVAPIPPLTEVIEALAATGKVELPGVLARWLDALDATQRWALLKLITGELRVGVSARLAKTALANYGRVEPNEIEELWHGLAPPYLELFAWLEKRGGKPVVKDEASFRPLMLATALDETELTALAPTDYLAEWKWDGIRVQLAARAGAERRIFSRTGDEVSGAFPDMLEEMEFDAVLDGELLVVRDGEVAPFNHLQQRLNRKLVTRAMLADYPAHVRLYDILREGEEDLRGLGFEERRRRLEAWHDRVRPVRMDLSPLVRFGSWEELRALREGARENGIEGLMLKRRDSPYLTGRPKGPWFKWKRGALTADAVLMYAQRGHGKRSSYYSDYTFGAWRDGVLVPVGKAYFGFTDEELRRLDNWVRNHTVNRFGPVREVEPKLVLEVAFDSLHRSTRHKSGIAMRFPRIHRIRWDKPAEEADRLETLERMIVK